MRRKRCKIKAEEYRNKPCEVCGATFGVVGHHIKSFKSGGKCEDNNMIPLCYIHHHILHSLPMNDFIKMFPRMKNALESRAWELDKFSNKWLRV